MSDEHRQESPPGWYRPKGWTIMPPTISPTAKHHKVVEDKTPWALYGLDAAVVLLALVLLWRGRGR